MDCYCWDGPEVYQEAQRKAKKIHFCGDCCGTIQRGEAYLYMSGIWSEGPASYKRCLDCNHLRCDIGTTQDCACIPLDDLFQWLKDAQPYLHPGEAERYPWSRWVGMFNAVANSRGSVRRLTKS